MRPIRSSAAVLLLAGPLASACECSDRRLYELEPAEGTAFEMERSVERLLTAQTIDDVFAP